MSLIRILNIGLERSSVSLGESKLGSVIIILDVRTLGNNNYKQDFCNRVFS